MISHVLALAGQVRFREEEDVVEIESRCLVEFPLRRPAPLISTRPACVAAAPFRKAAALCCFLCWAAAGSAPYGTVPPRGRRADAKRQREDEGHADDEVGPLSSCLPHQCLLGPGIVPDTSLSTTGKEGQGPREARAR